MTVPSGTYTQLRDPAYTAPGLPGPIDITARTIQCLAIAALNGALPPITTTIPDWRNVVQSRPALPTDADLSRLIATLAAAALTVGPGI